MYVYIYIYKRPLEGCIRLCWAASIKGSLHWVWPYKGRMRLYLDTAMKGAVLG